MVQDTICLECLISATMCETQSCNKKRCKYTLVKNIVLTLVISFFPYFFFTCVKLLCAFFCCCCRYYYFYLSLMYNNNCISILFSMNLFCVSRTLLLLRLLLLLFLNLVRYSLYFSLRYVSFARISCIFLSYTYNNAHNKCTLFIYL